MGENIYVTRPSLPPFEEYIEYLKEIWETCRLTNFAKYHEMFREKLQQLFGVEHCMLFTNGHMALELGFQAFGLSGEVITTPFTFASTTHAIVRNGLEPVFCDVREGDCTIDPAKIEELITDKTCAIVPVHVYGLPCDVEAIEKIARKHKLKVIYDAAHAFGETVGDRSLVSYGDAAMLSFHATKAFNTVEGGCLALHDEKIALRLYQLENFGIMSEERVEYVGANAKMNEFQAAMGLCNLKYFQENVSKRKERYEFYREHLQNTEGIRFLESARADLKSNYNYCPVIIEKEVYGYDRDFVYSLLKRNQIFARKYFYPLTNEFQCYMGRGYRGNTPVAHELSQDVLTLPLYADLEIEDIRRICKLLAH